MKKSFYVVVPYDPIVMKSSSFWSNIKGFFSKVLNLNREAFSSEIIMPEGEFQRSYQQLIIRQDTVITHFNRMGLEANVVLTDNLIQLYYSLYNPDSIDSKITS